ncbi:MAG: polyribonucleotide nucleotidyltransferase, partial [Deltaproteobacteria bacterium]|nr:polyribonucleotide nucleotidyltransferase [Deltaproteobacteria bacterium]
TYAAGRIPGGFFKREAKLRDNEVLTCRMIDRPNRPLFPKGYKNETQVVATVLSADQENLTDVLALTGASAALTLSDIPYDGPIAGVRVGRIDGKLIANPTLSQLEESDIDIVVAASKDAIVMVEGEAREVDEASMVEALLFGHDAVQPTLDLILSLRESIGKPKRVFVKPVVDADLESAVRDRATDRVREALKNAGKLDRHRALDEVRDAVIEEMSAGKDDPPGPKDIASVLGSIEKDILRADILERNKRVDGRGPKDIRQITCELDILPRVHGSALFTRGETQAIVTTTLGTHRDEQKIDGLLPEYWKSFILHYNFPPYCVGEVKMMRGPSRREVGHGNLAERSLSRMVPRGESFPYTIRVVSEITESNGSSSMATVCGGTLSLMDAGVPVPSPVAGIAMGLVLDEETGKFVVLSDILGDEDHLGDMDFKVTGTATGITAMQMDIKVKGVTKEILEQALAQAREGRLHILEKMLATIPHSRPEMKPFAPRHTAIKINPNKIRDIIGKGGATIRAIQDETETTVDVEDDGTVTIYAKDGDKMKRALEIIDGLTQEPEEDKVYEGPVRSIKDFGAFVEILPGTDGLVHISELAPFRVGRVEDVLKEGDTIKVRCIGVDQQGKVKLSHREFYDGPIPEGGGQSSRPSGGGGQSGGRDRRPRSGGGSRRPKK